MRKEVSIPTLRRLPNYYHIVCQALEAGDEYISSKTIARLLDIDDTQVRKDIASVGYVGKPKFGFEVSDFKKHLESFLGFNNTKEAFLIGAGNLGVALAKYDGFKKYGLDILALFDSDPIKVGLSVGNKEVFALAKLPDLAKRMNIQIAIITVPSEFAQGVTDFLVKSGIKAIWNFAPANLSAPDDIFIWNQDLAANFVTFAQLFNKKNQQQ